MSVNITILKLLSSYGSRRRQLLICFKKHFKPTVLLTSVHMNLPTHHITVFLLKKLLKILHGTVPKLRNAFGVPIRSNSKISMELILGGWTS